jgi:hypothetical protein
MKSTRISPEGRAQTEVLLDVQGFRPDGTGDAQLGQFGVHALLA